eukprot:NODE_690_length_4708_cov_1.164895.p1 type:complete len:380 gc:universal NODE_690_length_4708_cov_1.164895:2298-1159(-)
MRPNQLLSLLQQQHPLDSLFVMINRLDQSYYGCVDFILSNYPLNECEDFILELCIHNCIFVKQVMQHYNKIMKKACCVSIVSKLLRFCPLSVQFFKVGLYYSMSLEEIKCYVGQLVCLESLNLYISEELLRFAVELDHIWQLDENNDVEKMVCFENESVSNKLNYMLVILIEEMKKNDSGQWIELYRSCVLPTQSHALNMIYLWYVSNSVHRDEFLAVLGQEWLNGNNVLIRTRSIWYLCGFLIRSSLDFSFLERAYILMISFLETKDKDLIWYATIQSAMYLYCFQYSKLPVSLTIRLISQMKHGALSMTAPIIVDQFCKIVEQEQLWFARVSLKKQRRSIEDNERQTVEMLWQWFPLDPIDLPIFKQIADCFRNFTE